MPARARVRERARFALGYPGSLLGSLSRACASARALGSLSAAARVEAAGFVGNEKVEAQEKDITIRVGARANILRNALIIGGVIALVVGVAITSIRVSRR